LGIGGGEVVVKEAAAVRVDPGRDLIALGFGRWWLFCCCSCCSWH